MNLNNYTKKVSVLVAAVAFLFSYNLADAQVLYHEQFDGGLGDWTTVGYETPNAPDYDYENYVWVWSPDGFANSQFRPITIESETVDNGAALLFGEGYQKIEYPGLSGIPGPPYPDIHSELISPVYDISSTEKVNIEWTQVIAELANSNENFVQASFAFKIDGGDWTDNFPVPNLVVNGSEFTETLDFYIPEADNANTIQIKFIYYQSFYYWIIDDVKIKATETYSDLEVSNPFVTPIRYGIPEVAMPYDTFYFTSTSKQLGTIASDDVIYTIRIVNAETGEVKYETSKNVAALPLGPGGSRVDSMENLWAPTGLTPGIYQVQYTLSDSNYTDTNPDNNTAFYTFEVTENVWKMDNGQINGRPLSPNNNSGNGFDMGVLYKMPKEVTTELYWDKVQTAYDTLGGDITDYGYNFNLTTFVEQKVCDDLSLFNTSGDGPATNEQFDVIATEYLFLEDYAPATPFDVELKDFDGELLPLEDRLIEPGKCYIFWVNVPDFTVNAGIATNYRPFSPDIEQSGAWRPTVYDPGRTTYFTGGWDGSRVPIMRASFFMDTVSTNENPLPEYALNVYPNPVQDVLTAEINLDKESDVTVIIADMQGKVNSLSVEKGITTTTLQKDVSDLAPGSYIFRISTKEGAKNIKFIKQ